LARWLDARAAEAIAANPDLLDVDSSRRRSTNSARSNANVHGSNPRDEAKSPRLSPSPLAAARRRSAAATASRISTRIIGEPLRQHGGVRQVGSRRKIPCSAEQGIF
jgi:hypothetical protein